MKNIILLIIATAAIATAAQNQKPQPQPQNEGGPGRKVIRLTQVITNINYSTVVLTGKDATAVKAQLLSITNADGSPIFDTFTESNRYVEFKLFSTDGVSISVR